MKSTLPSRWQEILRREAAENVGTVLAQARDRPDRRRLPRWTIPAVVVGVASVSLFSLVGGSASSERGGVPFDRSTVISTRTAGFGASAEDLQPPAPAARPAPDPGAILAPDPPRTPALRRQARQPEKTPSACPECDRRRAALAAAQPSPFARRPSRN